MPAPPPAQPEDPDAEREAVIRRLIAGTGAADVAETVLEAVRAHLGMEVAFLSEFVDDRQVHHRLQGDGASFGLRPGGSVPLESSYCAKVVRGVLPSAVPDAGRDPLAKDLPATAEAGIGAYIGVPVRHADGDLYGTLCGVSHGPRDLRARDVRFLEVLASLIAGELRRDRGGVERRRRHARQIARALDGTGVSIHLQPIVRLADRRPVGFEALARFDGHQPPRGPDEWFAAAWDIGLGAELELVAIRKALPLLGRLPAGTYLSVNADPRTVVSAPFRELLAHAPAERLLVELTEHTAVADYAVLGAAIAVLRAGGARFAVDDVGAGYAGLNHIMRVGPEVLKLDRFLIGGVDGDPARRALVAAAAAFAAATRTRVIAEGIETPGELEALQEVGIRYGQGFHLGRPAAVETFAAAG